MRSRRFLHTFSLCLVLFVTIFLPPSAVDAGTEGKGRYMHYEYSYMEKDGTVAALFSPFLPRNDTIIIGAMLELINVVYGKHQVEDFKPTLVNRGGRNLIRFRGIGYDYFFLLIKQDTGEVHSLTLWREKRA